uniref:Uncharacterized protein n=1 Tax=Panagrolaimus sp. ES5 TaxID=591445 RepID=A0AC34GYB2_9BILA
MQISMTVIFMNLLEILSQMKAEFGNNLKLMNIWHHLMNGRERLTKFHINSSIIIAVLLLSQFFSIFI